MQVTMDAIEAYTEFCTRRSRERQTNPTDDLMSVLVHAEVDGDAAQHRRRLHESLLILVGGDETTRHVVSGGIEQLLRHPDQRQLLVDDLDLLADAVEEMLRWVSADQEHVPHDHGRHRVPRRAARAGQK